MNRFLYTYILSALILSLAGCVSEVTYDVEGEEYTILEGIITDSPGESIIRISKVSGYSDEKEPVRASGVLYKNNNPEVDLTLLREGELALPITLKLETGASYHIEVTTEDNITYHTIPQIIQPVRRTDSLSFDFDRRLEGYNSAGAPLYVRYVDVFAHVNLPAGADSSRFFRWDVDEAWAFEEAAATPTDPVAVCYLRRDVTENPVTILTNSGLSSGPVKIRVSSQPLDEAFLQKHYFNAYLHSIDRRAYEFYEQAQRLIDNTGNIFDEIPAPIKGNIFNPEDESEVVLGYVEFSKADTLRLAITRDQIPFSIFDLCSLPNPCIPRNLPPGVDPPPCKCFACAAVYGFGTLNPPFYWE